jgi:TrmH family RNA methyltransferase
MITGGLAGVQERNTANHIKSARNPLIQTVRRLAHPRRREDRFLLEGRKLLQDALASGVEIERILVSSRVPERERIALRAPGIEITEVSDRLFGQLSSLEFPQGFLALARRPERSLTELRPEGFIVVSAGIQDPGNLGAVARVAEAAGSPAMVVLRGSCDPFGPKALRGSMGSLLRVPVYEARDEEAVRERGFQIAALVPRGGVDFRAVSYRPPLALLLGREGAGLEESSLRFAAIRITVPMKGAVESMNVATAAALVLYEAIRPRD